MTIVDVHKELYGGDISSFDTHEVIEVYERYKELIETTEPDTQDYLWAKVTLLSDYAYSLAQEKRYSVALPYLGEAIQLWETREREWSKPLKMTQRYEVLRFLTGITQSKLRKPKEAQREFEWLVQNYPQNELYSDWLRHLKKRKIMNVCYVAMLISMAFFVLSVLVFGNGPITAFSSHVFMVCAFGNFGSIVYYYFIKKSPKSS